MYILAIESVPVEDSTDIGNIADIVGKMAFPLTEKIPPLLNTLTKDIVVRQVYINEIKGFAEVRQNLQIVIKNKSKYDIFRATLGTFGECSEICRIIELVSETLTRRCVL